MRYVYECMNEWMDIVNSLVMEEFTMYMYYNNIIAIYMKMKWIDD